MGSRIDGVGNESGIDPLEDAELMYAGYFTWYIEGKLQTLSESKPPYAVVAMDQYHGGQEDCCTDVGYCDTLVSAIKVARKITEDSISYGGGSISSWQGFGEAGMVYDSEGRLVWDGILEYTDLKQN